MSSRREDVRMVVRGLIGITVGAAVACVVFAGPFWLIASRHDAITRFEDTHPVLDIVLGVSVLFLGCLPVIVGVYWLFVPDSTVSTYSSDYTKKGPVRSGSRRIHTSLREALTWIGGGTSYATVIGVVIYTLGR